MNPKLLAEATAKHLTRLRVTVCTQPPFIGSTQEPKIDLDPTSTGPEKLRLFCLACARLGRGTEAEAVKLAGQWLDYANKHAGWYEWPGETWLEKRLKTLTTWPWLDK